MAEKPTIRVVAAEIRRDGRYLITQRQPHATLPLLWEFPGGRVEAGETDAEALQRELREEMNIDVGVGEESLSVVREYDEYIIDFHVYRTELHSPEITPIKIHDYRWVTLEEMVEFSFPAADQDSVDALLQGK